jgi:hypothetical protein
MTKPKFDQDFWEQLWSKTLREHAGRLAHRIAPVPAISACIERLPAHSA